MSHYSVVVKKTAQWYTVMQYVEFLLSKTKLAVKTQLNWWVHSKQDHHTKAGESIQPDLSAARACSKVTQCKMCLNPQTHDKSLSHEGPVLLTMGNLSGSMCDLLSTMLSMYAQTHHFLPVAVFHDGPVRFLSSVWSSHTLPPVSSAPCLLWQQGAESGSVCMYVEEGCWCLKHAERAVHCGKQDSDITPKLLGNVINIPRSHTQHLE